MPPSNRRALKVAEIVSVTPHLHSTFHQLSVYLDEALAEDIDVRHGDAIQTDSAIGGQTGSQPYIFEFTYLPPKCPKGSKWHIRLTKPEFEDLAAGTLKELRLYRCKEGRCSDKFATQDQYCFLCDRDPAPLHETYLPENAGKWLSRLGLQPIPSTATKETVIQMWGKPDAAKSHHYGLEVPVDWILYRYDICSVSASFDTQGIVSKLTIADPDRRRLELTREIDRASDEQILRLVRSDSDFSFPHEQQSADPIQWVIWIDEKIVDTGFLKFYLDTPIHDPRRLPSSFASVGALELGECVHNAGTLLEHGDPIRGLDSDRAFLQQELRRLGATSAKLKGLDKAYREARRGLPAILAQYIRTHRTSYLVRIAPPE